MRKPCNCLYKLIQRGTEKKKTSIGPHASLLRIKGYVTFILNSHTSGHRKKTKQM